MADFLNDLSSARWWLSVVLVGILVNIAAPSLRTALGRLTGRLFRTLSDASNRVQRADEEHIAALRADPHLQIMAAFEEFRQTLIGTILFSFGAFFLGSGIAEAGAARIAQLAVSALAMLIGARSLGLGVRMAELLRRATPLPLRRGAA